MVDVSELRCNGRIQVKGSKTMNEFKMKLLERIANDIAAGKLPIVTGNLLIKYVIEIGDEICGKEDR